MGWLVFVTFLGYLVYGPAGALAAALLFAGAVFGIKGLHS
jgi:hypothetical protein